MDFSHVISLLGEPRFGGFSDAPSDPAWDRLEGELGTVLPEEYKSFVSAYGPCVLHGTFYVSHPRGAALNLPGFISRVSREARDSQGYHPEEFPYAVAPEPGGLVPVIATFDSDLVFLRPPGDGADEWTVMIRWDTFRWEWHRTGFVAFLERVLGEPEEIPLISRESFEWSEVPYEVSEYQEADTPS
ncbi:SMI1/KNR4 family protein [Streptomyces sp. NPDC048606]|uniref:SMI1/KNR4 family protein n=1 Tax=Streptomyces sp. NPDC048606 TaxID=3154726 RepID=UPI00342FC721